MKKITKKGFTLIELLAVIVILGILMLMAIPSVTKYIDESRKEVYVKTVFNMVSVIKNGIATEDDKYSLKDKRHKKIYLIDIDTENKINKSPYGNFEKNISYVLVSKVNDKYEYIVQAKDTAGYCINPIRIK